MSSLGDGPVAQSALFIGGAVCRDEVDMQGIDGSERTGRRFPMEVAER